MVARPPTSCTGSTSIGRISRTIDSGTANGWLPSCTSSTGRMASVSGSEMMKVVPLPGDGLDVDRAVELLDVGLDHVHADAATGDVGRDILGRETRQEDQVEALPLVHGVGLFVGDEALLHRLGAQLLRVHAVAVVGDDEDDVIAFLARLQAHLRLFRLAGGQRAPAAVRRRGRRRCGSGG